MVVILAAAGCAGAPPCARVLEAERAALLAADEAFSRESAEKGAGQAFFDFAASEVTMLPGGAKPLSGRENVRRLMADLGPGALTWKPVAAEASCGADLGYTWGKAEVHLTGPDGQPTTRYTKYVTVWKKQADGAWRFVVDIGNASPEP
jgi:ketosteroid isomerase-like protein